MVKVLPEFRLFLLLTLFSLVLLGVDTIHLLEFPKSFAAYLTNPISFGIYRTSGDIGKQFNFIFAARFAAKENQALKEQIGQLLSENANLRKKLAETESLLTQEKHLDPQKYNLVAARPIGVGRYLKIDKGSSRYIKAGQAVVFKDNYVGKIVSATPQTANVELLTDPDSKVTGFSQNIEGKAKGVLVGQFGTDVVMDKILHEEKIAVGDLVYSEGLEGFLPRGLILGRVSEVLGKENEIFKQAKVEPVFDTRDLDLVFVILE